MKAALFNCALVALACASSALACSCLPPEPLSSCSVAEGGAAVLVKVLSTEDFSCAPKGEDPDLIFLNTGTTISRVKILKIFEDNTDLELEDDQEVDISTATSSAACGYFMNQGDKYMLFVAATGADEQGLAGNLGGGECELPTAPLSTSLCSGNIQTPSKEQKRELRKGCKQVACSE